MIDADDAQPGAIARLLAEAARYGSASVRDFDSRLYGAKKPSDLVRRASSLLAVRANGRQLYVRLRHRA